MDPNCQRCQSHLDEGISYCPSCGLPQITFSIEETPGPISLQPWHEGGDDAGEIVWRPVLRIALLFSIPTSIAFCIIPQLASYNFILILFVAGIAVIQYVRQVQPAWITASAGASIGFVFGVFTTWFVFFITGIDLFMERFVFGKGAEIDSASKLAIDNFQQTYLSMIPVSTDPNELAKVQGFVLWARSPEGQASLALFGLITMAVFFIVLAMLGGVIGARISATSRRTAR